MKKQRLQIFLWAVLVGYCTISYSQSVDKLLLKGEKMLESGKYAKAIKTYSKIILLDSTLLKAYVGRGTAYLEMGFENYQVALYDDAISDFNKAIEFDSSNAFIYKSRGMAKYEKGIITRDKDDYGAIRDFEKAMSLDSSLIELYNTIGIIQNNILGNKKAALEAYTQQINKGTKSFAPYWNRTGLRFELKDYKAAILDYQEVIARDSIQAKSTYFMMQSYAKIGDALVRMNQHNKAIETYSKAIELYPRFSLAYYSRGLVHYKLNDKEAACSDWKRARRLARKELKMYCNQ